MQYLHTMVRISNVESPLDLYCNKLGLVEMSRHDCPKSRYSLIFLVAPEDQARAASERAPPLEINYNWDPEEYTGGRNFGHLAFRLDDIYRQR